MQPQQPSDQDSTGNRPLGVARSNDDARFRRLVEVSAVGVLTGDETGRIHYMNRALQELLGYSEHEVYHEGLRWTELTPPEYAAADARAVAQLGASGAAAPYEKAYRTKDGRDVPVLISPVMLDVAHEQHKLVAAFVIDLRAQKAAEQSTAQMLQLQHLTAALAGALTPQEIAQLINTHGCAAFGAQASFIALAAPDHKHFELVHSLGYRPEQTRPWQRFGIEQPLPATDAVRSGEPVLLGSVEELLARYPQLAPLRWVEYHARAAVPFLLEGRVLGVMLLSFVAPRRFSAEDVALMQTLGQLCAQALERCANATPSCRLRRTS
jgi:PAS domain S-box-containing protein